MSQFWFRLTLFWVLLGIAKTHHFFRLVVLATLGLAGLWMVHTLAQDFNAIQMQQQQQFHAFVDQKELYKREAKDWGPRGQKRGPSIGVYEGPKRGFSTFEGQKRGPSTLQGQTRGPSTFEGLKRGPSTLQGETRGPSTLDGPKLNVIYVPDPETTTKPNLGSETPKVRKIRPKIGIDWERVLSRDPVGCARSFLCQLAASEARDSDEELMLRLVSMASPSESWAVEELQGSVRKGEELGSAPACMKVYRYCPYSSRVMMRLIKFFGRSQ